MYRILLATLVLTGLYADKKLHYEKYYQEYFCKKQKGIIEYKLKDGARIDCLTHKYAWEVDFGRKAYEGIGQSMFYALSLNRSNPALILIHENRSDKLGIDRAIVVAKKYNIRLLVIDKHMKIKIINKEGCRK